MTDNKSAATEGPAILKVPLDKIAQMPLIAKTIEAASTGHAAALEPKFDGWRLIAIVGEDGECRIYNPREGNEMTGKLPAIEAALAEALPPGSVVDGEAVAFAVEEDRLVQKWGKAASVLGSGTAKAALGSGAITFVVFDLLAHGGLDARSLSYQKRRGLLESLFDAADFGTAQIILVPQLAATDASHETLIEAGYEGSVVKHLDAPYASGKRGKGWFKVKPVATVDAIITGYTEGENGFLGYIGAVTFGQYNEDGILVPRGKCSGMDWDVRKDLTANREANLNRVIEVAHEGTFPVSKEHPLGAFRFPRFKRFRDDKPATEVTVHDS